ncbi:FAD-dependent monooxygenase [Whalleya microplaca]|nr:FAD-dependent monooxygenase [Whalleya microplaca]
MSSGLTQPDDYHQIAIVGGGIAGLTLALAFERLGIDYALFEAKESLAPNEGAGIGLLPTGLRVLDQLGLMEEIEKHTDPLKTFHYIDGHGKLLSSANAIGHYSSKIGYGGLFLERQKLLKIMSERLEGKGIVKTSTRVTSLKEEEDCVIITTSDGLQSKADLVIGADGVRSCVRKCIDASKPEECIHSDNYMSTRFACVYGISFPTVGVSEGHCFSLYRKDTTIIGFTGKGGVIFWLVVKDLGHEYPLSQAPRYSATEIDALCQSVVHLKISPITDFGKVYANRTTSVMICLEEGMTKLWHTNRMVIVGDAAHKMVPNAAMGANQAIESSATLVNEICKVFGASTDGRILAAALGSALARYQELREPRASEAQKRAGILCRAQLCHTGQAETMLEELPILSDGDWLFRAFMGFSEASMIESIPSTERARFYDTAVKEFLKKTKARQAGVLEVSNNVLMGLEYSN